MHPPVALRLPGGAFAARFDPLAIESEETLQEEGHAQQQKQAGTDAPQDVRRDHSPQPERESEEEDAGEVRADLVVNPRARCRVSAEIAIASSALLKASGCASPPKTRVAVDVSGAASPQMAASRTGMKN
jgi:hypothetical protein